VALVHATHPDKQAVHKNDPDIKEPEGQT